MVPHQSFGATLTRLRREHRLTQEELASRSGLSVRAISSLECGVRHPRRMTVERLAGGLSLAPGLRQQLIDAAADERWAAGPAVPAPATGLVGRDTEVATLRCHLRGDGPPLLCFLGEPGIGKSRLLAEAASLAIRRGSVVLAAACRRGGEPYAPIVDAFAAHARRLDPAALVRECPGLELLLPELTVTSPGVPSGQRRRLAFEAASRFLRLARIGRPPVVLLLDDLQWAGPAAADLLCHLARQAGSGLRIVIAARAGDLPPTGRLAQCLADLARLGLTNHHDLRPLPRPDADQLITAVAGDAPVGPAARRAILRRSAGLPLFLVELTRAGVIPSHLVLAVGQQVADLPEPAADVLRRLAVAGPLVPIEALANGSPSTEQLLDALDAAVRHRILEETARGFRFRYPLMREILLQSLGPARRSIGHRG
jgi:predicted ATPase/DNA-binding XRE family transcriptional regulator